MSQQQNQHRKALVITPLFATIFSTLAGAAIIGGVSNAWSINANYAVLQRDVKRINDANLEIRMTVLEQAVKTNLDSMSRVEANQRIIFNKLDAAIAEKRK